MSKMYVGDVPIILDPKQARLDLALLQGGPDGQLPSVILLGPCLKECENCWHSMIVEPQWFLEHASIIAHALMEGGPAEVVKVQLHTVEIPSDVSELDEQ